MNALSNEAISVLCSRADAYRVTVYPELASTNLTVRSLAAAGAEAGTVIFAERQTAGRGRLGRSFFSPAGSGIYMTLLLRPEFPPDAASSVTTYAAVATARAIERASGSAVSVKWVNDLWIGKKKVCGILAESMLEPGGKKLAFIALGIGINVMDTAFPAELTEIATSIEREAGRKVDRNLLAACLLEELFPLLSGDLPRDYMDEYRKRNVVLGRELTVISGGRSFRAVAKHIEDDGNLIVETEGGTEERIFAGEVSLRL